MKILPFVLHMLQVLFALKHETMKNDPFLSKPMDVCDENETHNVNDEKVCDDGSNYIEENCEDALKKKHNVNTTTLQWPMRHNNDTENISYSFNGFRKAKIPRCTYTGRISRIPSRYLDSDSDSSDGRGVRKDVGSRLKVKRRRQKHPNSNSTLLVNGFKEHGDTFSLKLADSHSERIISNQSEKETERLNDLQCSEVFDEISPTSDETISDTAHERQARRFFQVSNTLNEVLNDPESFLNLKLNGISDSKNDSVSDALALKEAPVRCLKATADCVDVSNDNKSRPRFDSSSMKSTKESLIKTECSRETSNELNRQEYVGNESTTDSTCNGAYLNEHESCDSSTNATFVSSRQNLKQSKVSCASLADNDCKVSFQKANDGGGTTSISFVKDCLPCQILNNSEETSNDPKIIEAVKDDTVLSLSEACLEKTENLADKQQEDKVENQRDDEEDEECSFKPSGLNCFRNYKMKRQRAYANKLNQKQFRRTEKTNGNSGLKKQGLVGQLKQKSVNKAVKLEKKINNKVSNKKNVQHVKPVKGSHAQVLDRVLGMRRNPKGVYEFLVQWTNGTSCWVSSEQIVTNKHNCILREYLVENDQDVSVINRLPFQAYCCDSLSLKECKPAVKTRKEKRKLLAKVNPTISRLSNVKQEVTVENDGDHCYITLNRETCKRKLTCVKIITELIAALEDASVSECKMVIIRGLGSKVFGGLNLENIYKASPEAKANVVLLKARYLVQTLSNYPIPLIALISKPAEGIGAVFLSLFDIICDEETWKDKRVTASCEKSNKDERLYSFPRAMGHSVPCEEILMGKKCETSQSSHPTTTTAFSESFFNNSGISTVVSTLKEIETTLHSLGKRPSLFGMNDEDVLKMNPGSEFVYSPEEDIAADNDDSMVKPENTSNTFLNVPTQHAFMDSNFCQSTGSGPVDRYVKELEVKICEEKRLAQQYFKELSRIWNDPSAVLRNEEL